MSEYYRNYCGECDGFFLDHTPVCPVCGGPCPSQSDRDEAKGDAEEEEEE